MIKTMINLSTTISGGTDEIIASQSSTHDDNMITHHQDDGNDHNNHEDDQDYGNDHDNHEADQDDNNQVVQLSLQPHSRRLATLGLRTINFCLCLTVIGHLHHHHHHRHHHHHHHHHHHRPHHHHHRQHNIDRWELSLCAVHWHLSGSTGERSCKPGLGLQILPSHSLASPPF